MCLFSVILGAALKPRACFFYPARIFLHSSPRGEFYSPSVTFSCLFPAFAAILSVLPPPHHPGIVVLPRSSRSLRRVLGAGNDRTCVMDGAHLLSPPFTVFPHLWLNIHPNPASFSFFSLPTFLVVFFIHCLFQRPATFLIRIASFWAFCAVPVRLFYFGDCLITCGAHYTRYVDGRTTSSRISISAFTLYCCSFCDTSVMNSFYSEFG